MTAIVPRWEWRAFGSWFGPAEDAFAALPASEPKQSDELYLVSTAPDGDTVKVRDDLLDIKLLRETDAAGLERWEPVLKAAFPVGAADVATVFRALRVAAVPSERETWTLDELIDEVTATGAVTPVRVTKRRVRYTVGGCTAELSDVTADGKATRTVAIEDPDSEAVVAAVASIGLDGWVNTSYPKGLAALRSGRPPRFAVIDVGTNSVKFHIGERDDTGPWRVVVDRAAVTRLGEDVERTGEIVPAALDRTADAIAGMVDEARSEDARAIVAVGTAGLRAAANRDAVIAAIRARAGISVQVISGEEEGRLAYLAAVTSLDRPPGAVVVFDTGGGSSQFTFGHGRTEDERFSVPVGAVRFTERFGLDGAVDAGRVAEARAAIAADLASLDGRTPPDDLIGMGGAITNLAAVMHGLATYAPDVVHGSTLDAAEIDRQIERYRGLDADGRRGIVGLQPARAEVILAGALIVRTVLDKLGQASLMVCDRGLRHGVLDERFGARA